MGFRKEGLGPANRSGLALNLTGSASGVGDVI